LRPCCHCLIARVCMAGWLACSIGAVALCDARYSRWTLAAPRPKQYGSIGAGGPT